MKPKKPISIRDVAEHAGVSIGTVSHALNGNAKARISKETQERIRSAALELGYRPNSLARSLWRGKTDTVGFLVAGRRTAFYVDVVNAAEKEIEGSGLRVLSAFTAWTQDEDQRSQRQPSDAFGWPVDGIVLWGPEFRNLEYYLGPHAADLPVVYLGSIRPDDTEWVGFDGYGGARHLTEHLVSRGYRRIAYASAQEWEPGCEDHRFVAYRDVCHEAGIAPRLLLMEEGGETSTAGVTLGLAIARMLPSQRPDAVYCHNDLIAIGVMGGLRRAGLRVPEDVAVAGYDGLEVGQCLDIPLTTIRIPGDRIAERAVRIVKARLSGEAQTSREQIVVPTELWVGGST